MKDVSAFKGLLVWAAVLGCCLPTSALAAGATPQPAIADVTLMEGGLLVGQAIDPQGAAVAETSVSLRSGTQQVAATVTDANGYFAFRGLQEGVYAVAADDGAAMVRAWSAETAPPAARPGVLLAIGGEIVRGKGPSWGNVYPMISNPWVVAGLVITAVAVPVALHDSKDSSTK